MSDPDPCHAARVVLDVTGDPDFRGYAGDWSRMLCQLAFKCDRGNRARLAMAFPEMVGTVDLYERNGPEFIRDMATYDLPDPA